MTTIYLVRHCEPDFSFDPNEKRPLTVTGRQDAEALAEYLSDKKINCIYSSPYTRAVETVTPLSRRTRLPIITDTIFRERFGGHGEESFEEFSRKQWTDLSYKRPGAESIGETMERMIQGITEILNDNTGENVVISSHGAAVCSVLRYYHPTFGYRDFMRVIDFMPWIVRIQYHGTDPASLETADEIWHIHRPYSG
ncbi:MAG TPA: histidine phosphatase family protein [Ruminococcus sp.]|nr:histidine phosphatase family protein [Ruminococcus sp.]